MVAGRELDALVAEHVMKWTFVKAVTADSSIGTAPDGQRKQVPNYSTEIKDAWAVVERLRITGWFILIGDDDGPEWEVSFMRKANTLKCYMVYSNDVRVAICKTALLAVLGL